jgi:hypothetical protein
MNFNLDHPRAQRALRTCVPLWIGLSALLAFLLDRRAGLPVEWWFGAFTIIPIIAVLIILGQKDFRNPRA